MKTSPKLAVLAILLGTFCAWAVYAATFDEGYNAGCSIGLSETYYNENLSLYLATLDYGYLHGEIEYANGVEGGYDDCRMQPTPAGGPGAGTTCTSNPKYDITTCN
ncbi:MAG: hypothetical protein AAF657_26710 [Acidobacteriota bacterium]